MALYTKADFARLFDRDSKWLSNYIIREKVVVNSDGYIDDKNVVNKIFKNKWLHKKKEQASKPTTKEQPKERKDKPQPFVQELPASVPKYDFEPDEEPEPDKNEANTFDFGEDPEDVEKWNKAFRIEDVADMPLHIVEQELKKADLVKKYHDGRYAQVKADKAEGQVVPTDLIIMLIPRLAKEIYASFEDATSNLLDRLQQRHNMNNQDIAEYRTTIIEYMNKAIKDANDNALNDLDAIVAEFSETRGKGEKK